MMFKPKPPDAIADALCVLKANPQHIPVTPNVVMSLWEGVRELYRRQDLTPKLENLTIQFRHKSIDAMHKRIVAMQPYIDLGSYPEGVRVTAPDPRGPCTIGEYITYEDGFVRTLPDVVLDIDEAVELFAVGLIRLHSSNRNVYTAISDRLYYEMADIISLSEVLLNEGYHEETCLLTNCISRLFKKRG